MSTLSNILLATIFVIVVDFAYWLLHQFGVYERRPSVALQSRVFVRLKQLTRMSCPHCSGANLWRSHRRLYEKPLGLVCILAFRCMRCQSRCWSLAGSDTEEGAAKVMGRLPHNMIYS